MDGDTFNHGEKPGVWEILAVLSGQTTYRVPVGGRSTRHGALPHPHRVAAELAIARDPADALDCGPEVVWDRVTQSGRHRVRICKALAEWLRGQRWRSVERSLPYLRIVSFESYLRATESRGAMRMPDGIRESDWEHLTDQGHRRLDSLADGAAAMVAMAFACDL